MRAKYLIIGMSVAVVGACGLWWHEQAGADGDGIGCYVGSGLPAAFASGRLAGADDEVSAVGCGEHHDFEAIGLTGTSDVEAHCRSKAEAFLGGLWELSRAVMVTVHSRDPMRGTTMCALAEVDRPGGSRAVSRTGSLRDGLRGTRPLAITCLTGEGDGDQARFIDCTQSHAAEFVGTVPRDGDSGTKTACTSAAARYLGLPDLNQRTDLRVDWIDRDSALCVAVAVPDAGGSQDTLRGGLQGLGTGPLPR